MIVTLGSTLAGCFRVINPIHFFGLTSVRMECEGETLKQISQKNKGICFI